MPLPLCCEATVQQANGRSLYPSHSHLLLLNFWTTILTSSLLLRRHYLAPKMSKIKTTPPWLSAGNEAVNLVEAEWDVEGCVPRGKCAFYPRARESYRSNVVRRGKRPRIQRKKYPMRMPTMMKMRRGESQKT